MKTFILLMAIFVFGFNLFGQNPIEKDYEQAQAQRSQLKRVVLEQFIELEAAEADVFWSIYEEYEQKRLQMGRDRMEFLHQYTLKYSDMTDDETDDVMKLMINVRKAYHSHIDEYYEKIRSLSGSRAAAQFYQLEYYYMNLTRVNIMNNMPFFGEEAQEEEK